MNGVGYGRWLAAVLMLGCASDEPAPTDYDAFAVELDPACPSASQGPTIDLRSATVTGDVSIFASAFEKVSLALRGRGGEGTATLRADADGHFSASVLAGEYDLYWVGGSGDGLPRNGDVLLRERVAIEGAMQLDVVVPMVEVRGTLTVDGALVVQEDDYGPQPRIFLWSEDGDRFSIAGPDEFAVGTYDALVVPGIYDVEFYWWDEPDPIGSHGRSTSHIGNLPDDHRGIVRFGVDLTESRVLDLEIERVQLVGTVTSDEDLGGLGLQLVGEDRRTMAKAWVIDGSVTGLALPATYDVFVESRGPARTGVEVAIGTNLSFHHASVALAGTIALDPGPVTEHADQARVMLAPARPELPLNAELFGSGHIAAWIASDGSFAAAIPTGRYHVSLIDGVLSQVLARDWAIDRDQQLDFRVGAADVTTSLTLVTGDVLPPTATLRARVPGSPGGLTEGSLDPAKQLLQADAVETRTIPAGVYDIEYDDCCEPGIPDNRWAWLRKGVRLDHGSELELVVPVREVELDLVVDGTPLTGDARRAFFVHRRGDAPTDDGSRETGSFRLFPGTYDVHYDNDFHDPSLPVNRGARVGCVNVQ